MYIVRMDTETANDRNDRAIREVCKYYNKHLGGQIQAVLLTDDKDNLRQARAMRLNAANCREYVESLNRPELLERIAAKEEKTEAEISEKLGMEFKLKLHVIGQKKLCILKILF